MSDGGILWFLWPDLFNIVGLSKFQLQASSIILTNEFGISIVEIPSVAIDDDMLILSNPEDDICVVGDFYDTSPFILLEINISPL